VARPPYTGPVPTADACPPVPAPLPAAVVVAEALERLLLATPPVLMAGSSRRAAVLIALYDRGGAPHIVLTKRAETLPHHSGQVSLPGGRRDPEDADLRATAVRESFEELGIEPASVRVVGRLDDVHARGSDHIIAPFVGVLTGALVPLPNAGEVSRVLEVSLEDVLAADALLPPDPGLDVATLRYPLLGEDVWGATARILRRFARLTRCALGQAGG
jgi:8-oxo-dGTP pyrophosphatase MutT (NUDIX family)